jgi:hypothetical protein
VWKKSRCIIDDLLSHAQCIEQFFVFDFLTGVGGVLELGSPPPQRRECHEGRTELSADCLFDSKMPTFLGGPEALLRLGLR